MPIYLRSTPGSKKGGDVTGPYEESKIQRLREYAQGLSDRNKNTVEAYWVCGRRRPMLLAMYQEGRQKYPRNAQEERQLQGVATCLARPGAESKSLERSPRAVTTQMFSKARKLPQRFACPVRIVSSQPLQDFTLPHPVMDVGGEQILGDQFLPPPIPPGRFSPVMPEYWSNRSNFEPSE